MSTDSMRRPGRGMIRRAAGFLIAVACLYLAFRGVNHLELTTVLRNASPTLIVAAGMLLLLMGAIKCTKLGVLLRGVRVLRYRVLFAAEMISILVDIVFPFRLQELVKAYVVGRGAGIRPSFVFGAEMVEKCVEFLCLLGVLFTLSVCHPLPLWLTVWIRAGAAAAVAAAVFLSAVLIYPDLNERTLGWLGRLSIPGARRLRELLGSMLRGIREAAIRPMVLLRVLAITLVEWLCLAATLWVAARAAGVALSAPALLGVLAANMIAFAVPTSTSGSVGIYELAGTATLVLVFGLSHEYALAAVLALHFVMVVFGVVGGLVGLRMTHLTLAQVWREADTATRGDPGHEQTGGVS